MGLIILEHTLAYAALWKPTKDPCGSSSHHHSLIGNIGRVQAQDFCPQGRQGLVRESGT